MGNQFQYAIKRGDRFRIPAKVNQCQTPVIIHLCITRIEAQ